MKVSKKKKNSRLSMRKNHPNFYVQNKCFLPFKEREREREIISKYIRRLLW